ncbi:hypothetical protein CY35_01G181400 [Sphagnum magellanicum]|nr:hypothetical protein CY35_01G181400 [Sphagnum magellanicum]
MSVVGRLMCATGAQWRSTAVFSTQARGGEPGVAAAIAVRASKSAGKGRRRRSNQESLKKVNSSEDDADSIWTARHAWACVKGCGACCVLDKGPDYPPVEEILTDPDEVALFRSMVGADGWCIHYDKPSRSCTIHNERPRFCRVEPETFKDLYGIEEKDMDKAACGFCQDQIRSVYGGRSKELKTFQRVIRNLEKG